MKRFVIYDNTTGLQNKYKKIIPRFYKGKNGFSRYYLERQCDIDNLRLLHSTSLNILIVNDFHVKSLKAFVSLVLLSAEVWSNPRST